MGKEPLSIGSTSLAESALDLQLRATCQSSLEWQREFVFHSTRKWRADFAIWQKKIAPFAEEQCLLVEIEGAVYGKPGRHQRVDGMERDCEKYAEALLSGYPVLRVTPKMVRDGRALQYIERYFNL